MSHNPTYDPEPGYNGYGDRNGSGHSTPRQFYSSSVPPAGGDYPNMASYRQATAGAPPTDVMASNGKSYRYATEDTIPEDEDEPDTAANPRQVQFTTDSSYPSKPKSGKSGDRYGSSSLCFKILIGVLILVSILALVFLILYVISLDSTPEQKAEVGGVKQVSFLSFTMLL